MAEACIILTDDGPAIQMHVVWGDKDGAEFDRQSPAHQHMQLLISAMDTIAQKIPDSEPLPTAVTVARMADELGAKERRAIADGTAEPMFGNAAPIDTGIAA